MTATDVRCAISRYCERLANSGVKPTVLEQIRATLQDFSREVQRDMDDHPGLFEHPHWGDQPKPPATGPKPAASLDCAGGPGAKVSLPTRRP